MNAETNPTNGDIRFKTNSLVMKNKKTFYRAWINAPSTLQTDHKFHGMKGFRGEDYTKITCVFYPIDGDVVSFIADRITISEGRPKN